MPRKSKFDSAFKARVDIEANMGTRSLSKNGE